MLIWTNKAIINITNFIKNSKEGTKAVAKAYMNNLIEYANIIETMNMIGKKIEFITSKYEIRQVIYKKHKIIYHIKDENIVILAVVHSKQNIKTLLKDLEIII